jgi:hypothetical protein
MPADYINTHVSGRCRPASLADAFRQYEWNGKPWSENFGELTTYRRQLRTAIETSNSHAAFAVREKALPLLRAAKVADQARAEVAAARPILAGFWRRGGDGH